MTNIKDFTKSLVRAKLIWLWVAHGKQRINTLNFSQFKGRYLILGDDESIRSFLATHVNTKQ